MQDHAFSLEEIDREVVELLPDREELLLNNNQANSNQSAALVGAFAGTIVSVL